MANPQPHEYTKLSNELYAAIMQSDFSKRQRNILDLIIRMSYGCGKKSALLRPVDFSVVGVGKNYIKTELDYLKHANVIFINGEQITLNKDYDKWRVSLVSGFNEERFREILHKNLQHKTEKCSSQNGDLVPETGTSLESKVPEIGITSNYKVPETGTDMTSNPLSGTASQTPKESIKEIYTTKPPISPNDEQFYGEQELLEAIDAHMSIRMGKHYATKGKAFQQAIQLFKDKVPIDIIIKGINECFDHYEGPGISSFSYCVPKIYELFQRAVDIEKSRGQLGESLNRFYKEGSKQNGDNRKDPKSSIYDDDDEIFYGIRT